MSCEEKIRVGIIGLPLEIEAVVNCTTIVQLQTSNVKNIIIVRPDGTNFTRAAIFTTDGTDGKIYILTVLGDLTMSGTYYIQAYLELPAWQGHSDIGEFEVFDNLV